MAKMSDYYKPSSINAEYCTNNNLWGVDLKIEKISTGEYDNTTKTGQTIRLTRIEFHFSGIEPHLVINKMNSDILIKAWGNDWDAYIGQILTLVKVILTVGGQRRESIQINPAPIKKK